MVTLKNMLLTTSAELILQQAHVRKLKNLTGFSMPFSQQLSLNVETEWWFCYKNRRNNISISMFGLHHLQLLVRRIVNQKQINSNFHFGRDHNFLSNLVFPVESHFGYYISLPDQQFVVSLTRSKTIVLN